MLLLSYISKKKKKKKKEKHHSNKAIQQGVPLNSTHVNDQAIIMSEKIDCRNGFRYKKKIEIETMNCSLSKDVVL